MRRDLMMSHGAAGLNVYLPEEAAAVLGGRGAGVTVRVDVAPSGERVVSVRRGGRRSLNAHRSPLTPHRICTRELDPDGERLDTLPLFAPVRVGWRVEDGAVTALLPHEEQLEPVVVRAPRRDRGATRSARVRHGPDVAHVAVAELGRILRELNALLERHGDGALADIRFYATDTGGTPEQVSLRRLTAERTEMLG